MANTATVMSTVAQDEAGGTPTPNLILADEANGIYAARTLGLKYKERDKPNSDDSLSVMAFTDDAPPTLEQCKAMMGGIKTQVRSKAQEAATTEVGKGGVSTFTGMMTAKDGIVFVNIGDSPIFIVGEKDGKEHIVQINQPQRISFGSATYLQNSIGTPDSPQVFEDQIISISWDEIRRDFGNNPQLIMGGDGLVETTQKTGQSINTSDRTRSDYIDTNQSNFAQLKFIAEARIIASEQAFEIGNLLKEAKKNPGANLAETLVKAEIEKGGRDDTTGIVVKLAQYMSEEGRKHCAVFFGDGAGGEGVEGSGAVVSQAAVKAAQEEVKEQRHIETLTPIRGQSFDPKAPPAQAAAHENPPQAGKESTPASVFQLSDTKDKWRLTANAKLEQRLSFSLNGLTESQTQALMGALSKELKALGLEETGVSITKSASTGEEIIRLNPEQTSAFAHSHPELLERVNQDPQRTAYENGQINKVAQEKLENLRVDYAEKLKPEGWYYGETRIGGMPILSIRTSELGGMKSLFDDLEAKGINTYDPTIITVETNSKGKNVLRLYREAAAVFAHEHPDEVKHIKPQYRQRLETLYDYVQQEHPPAQPLSGGRSDKPGQPVGGTPKGPEAAGQRAEPPPKRSQPPIMQQPIGQDSPAAPPSPSGRPPGGQNPSPGGRGQR